MMKKFLSIYLAKPKFSFCFSADENVPKEKNYNRVECCLCPNQTTTKHINRLFTSCGKKKDIINDIQSILDIRIESNHNSPGICRVCTNFLEKSITFRHQSKAHFEKYCSSHTNISIISTKRMASESPTAETPILKKKHTAINRKIKKTLDFSEFPSTNNLILEKMIVSTKALCKRKGDSILHNHSFQALEDFDNDAIWKEMVTHLPIFVEILYAIATGNQSSHSDNIKKSLRIKKSLLHFDERAMA